ncbi:MAG: Hsp33 family molecular chaperone HslO [Lachnospiraceae bacterium]|nr:Hsp33 family molecular chaperone HslO [Lachnospiraceae bacterium]MDD3660731.1 Hsp33 family molecular chaperone HslO [Lachnospiraceae bacterium]
MSDYIIRATAADSQIRVFAATTKGLVEEARMRHNTSPIATAALGRLLTAGAMMGSMLKGEKDLLTLQIKGSGPIGGLTVTADAKADVKGYVIHPDVMLPPSASGKLDVGGAIGEGLLSVIKDMGMKEPYSGQTVLQTGEIAEDLTFYFANSEQVPSSVGLGVLMEKNNTVRQAGGFIIQLMPFASDEVIDRLEQNLMDFPSVTAVLDSGATPEEMLELLFKDLDLEIHETIPTKFHCNCDKKRVEKALISIGKKDLDELISDDKEIEVKCHFCNTAYQFNVDELKTMRSKSRAEKK